MQTKIIIVTGKKQSGKDTGCQYLTEWLNAKYGAAPNPVSIKTYAFADTLKIFLMEHFGLTYEQCYGTNEQKNSATNVRWDQFSIYIRWKYTPAGLADTKNQSEADFIQNEILEYGLHVPMRSGKMTAREVMQVFGSDVCRKIYADCWANATINRIKSENKQYAFVCDARFPNELNVFKAYNPYVIRLGRNPFDDKHISETALDTYDFSQFGNLNLLDNSIMDIETKNRHLAITAEAWNL